MSDYSFDLAKCVVFDLECYPNHWCVGFHGYDRCGEPTTRIVETKAELVRMLNWFAKKGRTLAGYNSERFDVPLIRGILAGIDPYAPAQAIIRDDRTPAALAKLPEFPCDHIDISARLRRGLAFPGLKTVAANLGRPTLRELPFPPGAILTDEQWEAVKRYNEIDLGHTWALLERLAPELQALAALSQEQAQDLRSVSTPQVVERVFRAAYKKQHGREPARIDPPHTLRYKPVPGVQRPRTAGAGDWFDRITEPIPMVPRGEGSVPSVPAAKFTIGKVLLSVGAGGLHTVDSPGVYYATKRHRLLSVDVASFYPSLIAQKGITPAGYGDTGKDTYNRLLEERLRIKRAAKVEVDPEHQAALNVQADGLKLVLNSFIGKTGDPYSTLYDPAAFLAVTLAGQLMLIDLIERLTAAKVQVISANTDGLFLSVSRKHRGWRAILKEWQADTGMKLDIEGLKRLAILASNQYATRDARDRVKRKGGELRGALDWSHTPNHLVVNDAIVQALLFDVPPEVTIFGCNDPVRFCSVTKRSGDASAMVLVDGDTAAELPRVTRWYRARDSSKSIEIRFAAGRHTTPSGAQAVAICQDIPADFPDDIDWAWYLGQARRKIQRVPGYRHRSRRRLLGHTAAGEVLAAGLLPVPKKGKVQPAGSDVKHPTLLWDWSSYPTVGAYTGPMVSTLVIDVDDAEKFHKFVEKGHNPLFANRWATLDGSLVSAHGDATAEGVRTGQARGKLIFTFDGGPDHPLSRARSRWLKTRGVEVFYGNGLPSILGQYGDNGDQYILDGVIGKAPEWLVTALSPKERVHKPRAATSTPEEKQAALEGLPATLAELEPELGRLSVGWRRKDAADGGEIWVGRCPFPHDSGRSEDGDLDAGYHDDGPYVRCLHGSCSRIQETNRMLKERHAKEHPAQPPDPPGPSREHRGDDDDDSEPVGAIPWPEPPSAAAFYGLLGEIIKRIEPHTESDPLALLSHALVMFGNLIGRNAYVQVESTRHYLNEFCVNVGRSALGRKGTAADWAQEVFTRVDGVWATDRIQAGLSSGEGLITAVRDPLESRSPIREKGKVVDWQMIVTDAGITDKRLLILETEFGGVLRAFEREGNKLSALIRLAWDKGLLKSLTKTPHKATDAHVSILGHITIDELRSLLSRIDIVNGFANRFLWFAVRRQRSLPFGGSVPELAMLADSLNIVVEHARNVGRIGWTDEARELWRGMYDDLAGSVPPGPLGEVMSRCHPHVLRLASIYALADGRAAIGAVHLIAARALWDASARCARYIFGDTLGDPNAEKILHALKEVAPRGLTRTEIREGVFQRNLPAPKIRAALALLIERRLVREVKDTATGGRPAHRYFHAAVTP
jgi:hypothetical protein